MTGRGRGKKGASCSRLDDNLGSPGNDRPSFLLPLPEAQVPGPKGLEWQGPGETSLWLHMWQAAPICPSLLEDLGHPKPPQWCGPLASFLVQIHLAALTYLEHSSRYLRHRWRYGAALAEDPNSLPALHIQWLTTTCSSSSRGLTFLPQDTAVRMDITYKTLKN